MTTPQLKFSGSFLINQTDRAVPTPNPVEFLLAAYTKSACFTYDETGAITDQAVVDGSVSAPKCVFVELESGVLSLKWDTASDSVATRLSMDADPVPTQRAMLLLFTPVTASRTLYLTSVGAFRARVWIFQ